VELVNVYNVSKELFQTSLHPNVAHVPWAKNLKKTEQAAKSANKTL
jgi:hypothetical protein